MEYVPPLGSLDPDAPYIDGDPTQNIEGSIPKAASIEHPMREVVNVITQVGMVPDGEDQTQLYQAIDKMIADNQPPQVSVPIPDGYLSGFHISYVDSQSISVAPGRSIDGSSVLSLNDPINKNVFAPFVQGTGNGALDSGIISGGSIVAVFVIANDAGVTDILVSVLETPALPEGFTSYRRIGWLWIDADGSIRNFVMVGNEVRFNEITQDADFNLTTTPTEAVLPIPPNVLTHLSVGLYTSGYSGGQCYAYVSSPSSIHSDVNYTTGAVVGSQSGLSSIAWQSNVSQLSILSGANRKIRLVGRVSMSCYISVLGWTDITRGEI